MIIQCSCKYKYRKKKKKDKINKLVSCRPQIIQIGARASANRWLWARCARPIKLWISNVMILLGGGGPKTYVLPNPQFSYHLQSPTGPPFTTDMWKKKANSCYTGSYFRQLSTGFLCPLPLLLFSPELPHDSQHQQNFASSLGSFNP